MKFLAWVAWGVGLLTFYWGMEWSEVGKYEREFVLNMAISAILLCSWAKVAGKDL